MQKCPQTPLRCPISFSQCCQVLLTPVVPSSPGANRTEDSKTCRQNGPRTALPTTQQIKQMIKCDCRRWKKKVQVRVNSRILNRLPLSQQTSVQHDPQRLFMRQEAHLQLLARDVHCQRMRRRAGV